MRAGSQVTLGAITIGQSPRTDITPDLMELLPGVALIERGALDRDDPDTLDQLSASPRGDILATRLRDGTEIVIGEDDVIPRVESAIADLEQEGAELILLLCTGTFPEFESTVPILYPERILQGLVQGTFAGSKLGVITPNPEQAQFQELRWKRAVHADVAVVAASPYVEDLSPIARAAEELVSQGAEMIVMDCLGYSVAMAKDVRSILDCPVVLARTSLGRAAGELLGV